MPSKADEYRERAAACSQAAEEAANQDFRDKYARLAQQWEVLAVQRERLDESNASGDLEPAKIKARA